MKEYFVVGVNHIDMAFVMREEAQEEMLDIVLERVISVMERHLEVHYSLEQAAHYRKLEKRRPDLFAKVKKLLGEGRMEFMGGMATTSETNFPDGECFVRNQGMGLRWVQEHLGVKPENGWLIDTFGLNAQIPQIMKEFGFKHLYANRFGGEKRFDMFWDEGLDGSKVLILGRDLASLNVLPENQAFVFCRNWQDVDYLFADADGLTGSLPCLVSYYIENEEMYSEYYLKLVEERIAAGENWKHSTYNEYARVLDECGYAAPVLQGDLNPEFTGTYALRTPIRIRNRESETALIDAEKWEALLGNDAGMWKNKIEECWWDIAFCHFHDAFSGSHEDITFRNIMDKFDQISQTAAAIQKDSLKIADDENCFVCANSLPWARKEWVQVPASGKGEKEICVLADVPAGGIIQYRFEENVKVNSEIMEDTKKVIENEWFRLELDERYGIKTLEDKAGNCFMRQAADFLIAEEDKGSLQIELCEGRELFALTGQVNIRAARSSDMGESICMYGVFPDMDWNRGQNRLSWEAEFSLRREEKALRLKLTLDWKGQGTRIRLRIPGNMNVRDVYFEIPFGVVRRTPYRNRQTARGEWPAHRFVAMEDGDKGIALINKGVAGVEQDGNGITTTLIRAYGDAEGVWIRPSEISCQYGKQTFEFMIVPYVGTYQDAGIVRMAQQFNQPLQVWPGMCKLNLSETSMFEIDKENLVLSTIKRDWETGEELVIRVYETTGVQTTGRIRISGLKCAELSDMAENKGRHLECQGDCFTVEFKPFEIKTIRVKR